MGASSYRTKWLVYFFLCTAADALETVVSALLSETKPEVSLKASDVDTLTDEQIQELMLGASRVTEGPAAIWRLSPGTVAKYSYDSPNADADDSFEANGLNLIFARTNIPVPRVRRVIKIRRKTHLIVMDYINGPTLAQVWSTYSLWRKIRVAIILRRYVRQLRRVAASAQTPPGPVTDQGPIKCEVPSIFGQRRSSRGPFASYEELSTFMNKRYEFWFRQYPKDDSSRKERFDDSSPLVFTHNDLNPRNIIAGEDGPLWVVDWAWSGFYPPWFELCAMTNQVENEKLLGWYDQFWELMIPFVCGPYFKQQLWLNKASHGFYYK